jgi:hypothetical protein
MPNPVTPTNEELAKILPNIRKEFDALSSMSFQKYEERVESVTNEALSALQGIISDGTLSQDPEQLVRAVDVLTKAKTNLFDSKRKLLETLIKGEVMIKALEPPKSASNSSVLEDYIARQKNIAMTSHVNSVFSDIEKSCEK